MFIGIAMISVSMSISQVGIYGSFIGFAYVVAINIYCLWILLQARNRFKYDKIVDLPDLCARIFGEGTRIYMEIMLVVSQLLYLMCYNVFFGSEMDQMMCKTFEYTKCGHNRQWAIAINVLLLPVIYQRRMANVAYFSIVALIFTAMSILLIAYECIQVINTRNGGG